MCGKRVLHGFNAVAELKLSKLDRGFRNAGGSPRLQRRGRIEASWGNSPLAEVSGSPRLQRRGRIEASCFWVGATWCALVLHGFNAVAELKLDPVSREVRYVGVLHGFNAVAELKRDWVREVTPEPGAFSTASTPWPN